MENGKTNIFKNLFWIIESIWKLDKKYIFISIVSTGIGGVVPPISLIVMQRIINSIQLGDNSNVVFIYIVIYVGIDLVQTIYNSIIGYYNSRFSMEFGLNFPRIFLKRLRGYL